MVNRQNGTVRPDHPLTWPDMTLEEAANKFSTRTGGFRVFLEAAEKDADGKPIWPSEEPVSAPSSPMTNGNAMTVQQQQQQRPRYIIIVILLAIGMTATVRIGLLMTHSANSH